MRVTKVLTEGADSNVSMSDVDVEMHRFVISKLIEGGYESVADIVKSFPFHVINPTSDNPAFVSDTVPPEFWIHPYYLVDDGSDMFFPRLVVTCVHEMAHLLLSHFERLAKVIAQENGEVYDAANKEARRKLVSQAMSAKSGAGDDQIGNIFADLEIYCKVYSAQLQKWSDDDDWHGAKFISGSDDANMALADYADKLNSGADVETVFMDAQNSDEPITGPFLFGTFDENGTFIGDTGNPLNAKYFTDKKARKEFTNPIPFKDSKYMPKKGAK